jgi:hypothetical protein
VNKTVATSLALSVAALVVTGCSKQSVEEGPKAEESKVKCMSINECKGQGACDTATHSCAGQNECRGKGWILAPASECSKKGGKVI